MNKQDQLLLYGDQSTSFTSCNKILYNVNKNTKKLLTTDHSERYNLNSLTPTKQLN